MNKPIIIQIGKAFYSLKHRYTIKDISELKPIIEKYDIRHIKDKGAK